MSGTFIITPDSGTVTSGSVENNTALGVYGSFVLATIFSSSTGVPPPFPRILQGRNTITPNTGTDILRLGFSLTGNVIALDGNAAISFAGLPAGFNITSAKIACYFDNSASDATNHFDLTFDPSIISSDLGLTNQSFQYPSNEIPNPLLFFTQGCGFHVDNTTIGHQTSRWISKWAVSGTYSILTSSWTLPVTSNVVMGQKFTINGASGLSLVSRIHVQALVGTTLHDNVVYAQDFISQTDTQIVFWFPAFNNPNSGTVTLLADMNANNATQTPPQNGVLIGTVSIIFNDSSGLYVLTTGQAFDNVYNPNNRAAAATPVNILDPTVEFGFIP